jgi:hypothetical protein
MGDMIYDPVRNEYFYLDEERMCYVYESGMEVDAHPFTGEIPSK